MAARKSTSKTTDGRTTTGKATAGSDPARKAKPSKPSARSAKSQQTAKKPDAKPAPAAPASRKPTTKRASKSAARSDPGAGTSVRTRARAVDRKAETAARKAVIATALAMSRSGLSPGRSGNVSCRWLSGMLITPTGMAYESLKPADIVFVDADGSVPAKSRKPSSEWRFHLSAYRARADVGAVVHTHSLHATVLACAHKPIPAFHYMIAVAGGIDIPLIPYAPFGTEKLAELVASGLAQRTALLMANHGQIAVAKDLPSALELAHEVEVLAEQFYKVLTLGKPKVLKAGAMADVLVRFQSYGQNAQTS